MSCIVHDVIGSQQHLAGLGMIVATVDLTDGVVGVGRTQGACDAA